MAIIVTFGPSSNSSNSVIFSHIKVKLCRVLQGEVTLKPIPDGGILIIWKDIHEINVQICVQYIVEYILNIGKIIWKNI